MTIDEKVNEQEAVKEFSESFVNHLYMMKLRNGSLSSRISAYVESEEFEVLNEKYKGKGISYLGEAVKRLLDNTLIRFKEGYYTINS